MVGFQVSGLLRKTGGQWPQMEQSCRARTSRTRALPSSLLVDVVLKLLPSMPVLGEGVGLYLSFK